MLGIAIIGIFFCIPTLVIKRFKGNVTNFEIVISTLYSISLFVFFLGMITHPNEYYTAIDPVINNNCYTPLASGHMLTLVVYLLLYNISILKIWSKGINLPPLAFVLFLVFILIGLVLNVVILFQVSYHNIESLKNNVENGNMYLLLVAPLFSFVIGIYQIYIVIKLKRESILQVNYSNKTFSKLNYILYKITYQPFYVLLILLPIFITITIILTLFGQETDSIVKVFTDTTTWRFSQKIHPPLLPHVEGGHYLCTVAANGSPNIVKPLRFGKRGGYRIIVNRQLLIANAFESLLEDHVPKLHTVIRFNYDKYGIDLSKKINSKRLSNLTYILMKPLEWIFLICLYLFDVNPEERISRQYAE